MPSDIMRLVYFVRAGADGPIKIGFSWNPWARVADLQVGCPEQLRIIVTVKGDRVDERAVHRRFESSRLQGEWFKATPELLAFIVDVVRTESLVQAEYYARDRQFVPAGAIRPDPEIARLSAMVLAPDYRESRGDFVPGAQA